MYPDDCWTLKYIKIHTPTTITIQYRQVNTTINTVIPTLQWYTMVMHSVESYASIYPGLHSQQTIPILWCSH